MNKREFSPATGKCQHVVIEAVFRNEDSREMEEVLEELQRYGSAVIVHRGMVAEDFDEACKILDTRKERHGL